MATAAHYLKMIFWFCVVLVVGYFLVTNAQTVGHFVVMIVQAIWTFVSTVFNGIVGMFHH